MDSMIDVAISAARRAGKAVLDLSSKDIHYEKKNPFDILADADLASEKIIIDILKKEFPNHSFLAEESGEDFNDRDNIWIIDPVDGTINYAKGFEEYCVPIGYEKAGELVLGVIYQPKLDRMFTAEKGKGAFLNGARITVSAEKTMLDCLLSFDNTSMVDIRRKNMRIIDGMLDKVRQIRVLGSSALALSRIAYGQFDLYFKSAFNYWDYAAAVVILEEAGGKVTDFTGNKIGKDSPNIAASNGILHAQFLEEIKRALNGSERRS